MASITIRQRFLAPKQEVFAAVTPHRMLADALPLLDIDVIKPSNNDGNNGKDGLDSIRAMGFGFIKPLREQVVAYEAPDRLEYKIVGIMSKLIAHHHGVLTFLEEGKEGEFTLVIWHIELKLIPTFVSGLVLKILKQGIAAALAKQAKIVNQAYSS